VDAIGWVEVERGLFGSNGSFMNLWKPSDNSSYVEGIQSLAKTSVMKKKPTKMKKQNNEVDFVSA
jgi:hypothetical protein